MSAAPTSRDRGFTLVELIVTVVMIALLAGVIAASIIVILRSEDGVVATTSESHDTQQIVNYLPFDVESGPSSAAAYRAAVGGAGGDRGTGCSSTGNENVLTIDITDRRLDLAEQRVAYQLFVDGASARIDRIVCTSLDNGVTWNEVETINVADALDGTAATIASATVIVDNDTLPPADQQVIAVELTYTQRGDVESITAAPREEQPLATSGVCGSDPLAATRNIDTFVEGDVHLDGTAVKSALYVGGRLSFEGGPEIAQSNANMPDLGPGSPYNNVGLFAGSVTWGASSGTARVRSGTNVVVQDGNYVGSATGPISAFGGSPEITLSPGGAVIPPVGTELPVPAGAAFIELRSCSDRLAELPDSCNNGSCADHVGLPAGYPGTAVATGPQLDLVLTPDIANVLNLDESNLLDLEEVTLNPGAATIAETTPLVINVASTIGGTVNFTPPVISGSGSTTIHVIWNFPNAAVVNLVPPPTGNVELRGTLMAPYSTVTSQVSIQGGVIARNFVMEGASLNDVRSFEGEFGW